MEYVQMTLDDWVNMKQKLKEELLGVTQSFVRIGYALRQIDDQKLYERDGYKSVAEFAEKEYGLSHTTTSRFMSINKEYSIDGYSERLRPEFSGLGRSQLEEMLKLPEEDRAMIQPETSREDIRDLKRFNKTAPAAGEADSIRELARKFFEDNLEILSDIRKAGFPGADAGALVEIVNPAGNRSYKKGLYFLMMYENRVAVKKFGQTPRDMTWEEFFRLAAEVTEDLEGPQEAEEDGDEPATHGPEEETGHLEDEQKKGPAGQQAGEREEPAGQQAGETEEGKEEAGQQAETAEIQKESPVAPAQKAEEIQKEARPESEMGKAIDGIEKGAFNQAMNQPEVIEKPFGTRKNYIDTLTAYGTADYLARAWKEEPKFREALEDTERLYDWLKEEVDDKGRSLEE